MANTDQSWLTSDEQERAVRRNRALTEAMTITNKAPVEPVFSVFAVATADESDIPQIYEVEVRSLVDDINACTCPDYDKNGLGTCKHVEKVLLDMRRSPAGRAALEQGGQSPYVEVYVAQPDRRPAIAIPDTVAESAKTFMRQYLDARDQFRNPWETTLAVCLRDFRRADAAVVGQVRIAHDLYTLAAELERRQRLQQSREVFSRQIQHEGRAASFLRFPLRDYQVEGMLHLAFGGRAMLADDMGLGKTVQAIGASKVLRELWDIQRVLIVCPAALRATWAQQIRKFTDLTCCVVDGPRAARLESYRDCTHFFVIVNYDQIVRDEREIANILAPDLLILDEAQRIKNWRDKTPRAIKRLETEFVFVLTGTPLENRIDDVYSVVEFIDPHIFGSLFRFNRDFYQFDDRGRPVGLCNLSDLYRRLRPVMLRRTRKETRDQIADQTENTFFIEMTDEQKRRYSQYEQDLVGLLDDHSLQGRERVQQLLAGMRMVCDSVHLVDTNYSDSPKLDELLRILSDIWDAEAQRKVVVCSQWPPVLELLQHRLDANAIEYARCGDLKRFRESDSCRLLMLSDDTAPMKLQFVDLIVNLDLPWERSTLEKRISQLGGKAKHRINVVNVVAESTIEHRLQDSGTTTASKPECGASSDPFLERLRGLLSGEPAAISPRRRMDVADSDPAPVHQFREGLIVGLGDRLRLCQASVNGNNSIDRVLVVIDTDAAGGRDAVLDVFANSHAAIDAAGVHVLDVATYMVLRRMSESGVISVHDSEFRELYRADGFGDPRPTDRDHRRELAAPLLDLAGRKAKMATVLASGDFGLEAVAPMHEAVDQAAIALMVMCAATAYTVAPSAFAESHLATIRDAGALTVDAASFLRSYRRAPVADAASAGAFIEAGADVVRQAGEFAMRL
jgi:hypothetical protein